LNKKGGDMQKENRKLQRIDSDIYKIIATYVLENGIDAEVLEVKTSADLSECKVFVTKGMEELERVTNALRSEIAKRMNLKNTPKLKVILDRGRENADRVAELLQQINAKK